MINAVKRSVTKAHKAIMQLIADTLYGISTVFFALSLHFVKLGKLEISSFVEGWMQMFLDGLAPKKEE